MHMGLHLARSWPAEWVFSQFFKATQTWKQVVRSCLPVTKKHFYIRRLWENVFFSIINRPLSLKCFTYIEETAFKFENSVQVSHYWFSGLRGLLLCVFYLRYTIIDMHRAKTTTTANCNITPSATFIICNRGNLQQLQCPFYLSFISKYVQMYESKYTNIEESVPE